LTNTGCLADRQLKMAHLTKIYFIRMSSFHHFKGKFLKFVRSIVVDSNVGVSTVVDSNIGGSTVVDSNVAPLVTGQAAKIYNFSKGLNIQLQIIFYIIALQYKHRPFI
jgi:hypothetical protein